MYALASAHVKAHHETRAHSEKCTGVKRRASAARPQALWWCGGVVCFPWWDEPLGVASSAAVAAGLLEGHSRA